MTDKRRWMPVFALVGSNKVVHASHPDHKAPVPQAQTQHNMQRVGTAWLEEDGSYLIQLVALPVNGTLLMRPPRPDEHPDSTFKEVS